MPKIAQDGLWAGDEASLQTYLEATQAAAALKAAGKWDDEEDDEESRLVQVQDGVGVVSISGTLNNGGGFMNRLFGMTGYPEIRDAMIQAATDPEIKEILLDINSPGGTVAGLSDTASLIRNIHSNVKPVTAFTSGDMASAAYWLGSSAGSVNADRMANVGSIGVLATHVERSKQLKDEGLGVTVVRSGKYKALVNGVEPLSAEGLKVLQGKVDAADALFVEHVASMRNRSVEYTKEHMAQGREFLAEDAQRVGLVDSVTTFDALLTDLSKKSIATSKNSMDNGRNVGGRYAASSGVDTGDTEMKKKALTDQQIAAIASGAVLDATTEVEVVAAAGVAEEVEVVEASTDAGAGEAAETDDAAKVAASAEVVAKNDEGLRVMTDQLKGAQNDLVEAKIEGRQALTKVAELQAVLEPMSEVVAKAINNMQVALGGSSLDLSGMSPSALVAEHARVSGQFTGKFKAGGVAAVDAATKKPASSTVDPLFKARVAAVR